MQLTAVVTHEGDWYVARCPEVEVTSQGAPAEASLANLREPLELYFEEQDLPAGLEPPIIRAIELRV